MDRLIRKPLLLELSAPSVQHKRPGGFVKSRSHRLRQKTSAGMPTRPGKTERDARRLQGQQRLHQARDRHPGMSKRRAEKVRGEARPTATSHLQKKRGNPQARSNRLAKRGNPQARSKTEIRESPSKLERRPTLPKTPKFYSRSDAMKGRRI
jgi:hypothetical protein